MKYPILYSFKRCPYAMRARMAIQLADIKCELREVRLNNKPDQMLEVSPKGTVPVLVLGDKVIDESNDIINWVLNDHKIFEVNLSDEQSNLTNNLIKLFDENNSVTDQIAVDGGVADVSEEGITVLSERAEVLGSNASNKQIINEKINALNIKLKKPEFKEDETLKNELDFLNFVLEKSN